MQEQNYKTIARSRLTDRHRSDEAFLGILDTLIELKEERQDISKLYRQVLLWFLRGKTFGSIRCWLLVFTI